MNLKAAEGGLMDIKYGSIGVGYITAPHGCLCRVDITEETNLGVGQGAVVDYPGIRTLYGNIFTRQEGLMI